MIAPVASRFRRAADSFLNLVYPPVCQICGEERAGRDEGYVGPKCRRQVKPVPAPFCESCGLPFDGAIHEIFICTNCRDATLYFRFARSAVVFNQLMLDVIHQYKYSRATFFEPFLAETLIAHAAGPLTAEKWDAIVPVPLHPTRQREREFNQAERLGRHLGAATGIPVATTLLHRVKATTTQTQLNRAQRSDNMAGAFAPASGLKLNGERLILLDDVMTTGATTNACAKVLRDCGAGDIGVWTLARGT